MKKIILLSGLSLSLLCLPACKKAMVDDAQDSIMTEETVNVSVNSNQVYKYSLPTDANTSNVTVSAPSAKSAIAIVESTSGTSNFVYTPDQNFNGTDVVTIVHSSNGDHQGNCEHHGNCDHHGKGHHKGDCGNHDSSKSGKASQHKITFNIIVKSIIN